MDHGEFVYTDGVCVCIHEHIYSIRTASYLHLPTHPPLLLHTKWDGILQMWSYKKRPDYVPECRRQIIDFW